MSENTLMPQTVLRLKRETSDSFRSRNIAPGALSGYTLKISVDSAYNIDPNIFVFQRDVATPYAGEYTDTFYSIASVGELEFLPSGAPSAESTNFYRSDSVALVFETPSELESAWEKISGEVLSLAESNDLSTSTSVDAVAIYPADAFLRYYGPTSGSPTEQQIEALASDTTYSSALSAAGIEFVNSRHFSFAFPASMGAGSLFVDGVETPCSLVEATFTTRYSQPVPYKIYTTEDPVADGVHTVSFVSQ